MDISRAEQRILHLLAQGGRIELTRDDNRKIETIRLFTREGWVFGGLDLITFRKLKQKKAIKSQGGRPSDHRPGPGSGQIATRQSVTSQKKMPLKARL